MGRLSEEEERMLDRLRKKQEAPDPEPLSRSVRFSVDLGKKDQVELARKMGLIDDYDAGGGSEGSGAEEGQGGGTEDRPKDKVPKRGAYFDR